MRKSVLFFDSDNMVTIGRRDCSTAAGTSRRYRSTAAGAEQQAPALSSKRTPRHVDSRRRKLNTNEFRLDCCWVGLLQTKWWLNCYTFEYSEVSDVLVAVVSCFLPQYWIFLLNTDRNVHRLFDLMTFCTLYFHIKSSSLSVVLTATHQKSQKSWKWYYSASHRLNVNVMLSNITF